MADPIIVDIAAQQNLTPAPFSNEDVPVYAVMLTGKDISRSALAYNSIVSFLIQTYPNRYLIIVNDGEYHFQCAGIPPERIIEIVPSRKMLVGDLRNLALDHLPGGCVWIQWDDDDWHHPLAIAAQLAWLRNHGLAACTLAAQVKYSVPSNAAWEHRLPPGYLGFAGTVMVSSAVKARYPSIQHGEDSMYWTEVRNASRFGVADLPAFYYIRFIHNTNSSTHLQVTKMQPQAWNLDEISDKYLSGVLPLYSVRPAMLSARNRTHTGPVIYA